MATRQLFSLYQRELSVELKLLTADWKLKCWRGSCRLSPHLSILRILCTSFPCFGSSPISARKIYLTIRLPWSPSCLRADSQRGAAELTIARRKRGRVVYELF